MLPDSILPTPEADIARQLTRLEKRVESLERLEGGGALTLIEDVTLSLVGTFDFQNIPTAFAHLMLIYVLRSELAGQEDEPAVRFNNDAGANYWGLISRVNDASSFTTIFRAGTNELSFARCPGSTTAAGFFGAGELRINDYLSTTMNQQAAGYYTRSFGHADTPILRMGMGGGHWFDTPAVDRIQLVLQSGSNYSVASRASLYGLAS